MHRCQILLNQYNIVIAKFTHVSQLDKKTLPCVRPQVRNAMTKALEVCESVFFFPSKDLTTDHKGALVRLFTRI